MAICFKSRLVAAMMRSVGLDGFAAADALEALFLQNAQHLALHERRHIADFVQKDRTPGTLLELADATMIGAGERSLFMAEQLALQQRFGYCGAVDGQEMLVRPAAVMINGEGDQLLACPAFAVNQHGDVLRRDAADRFENFLHVHAAADELVAAGSHGLAGLDFDGHLHQFANLQRESTSSRKFHDVQRFEQIVVRASFIASMAVSLDPRAVMNTTGNFASRSRIL